MIEEPKLFPLEPAELRAEIKFTKAGKRRRVTHVFAPITQEQWIGHAARIVSFSESDGDEIKSTLTVDEAGAWLWEQAINNVEGYQEPKPENWQELIPWAHKQAAIAALAQVFEKDDDEEEIEEPAAFDADGLETVAIEAGRNGVVYTELTHVFKRPTTKQRIKFSRKTGASTKIRGVKGRRWRQMNIPQMEFACGFYDELIDHVSGYEPNDPEKMDAKHKQIAVQALMENV